MENGVVADVLEEVLKEADSVVHNNTDLNKLVLDLVYFIKNSHKLGKTEKFLLLGVLRKWVEFAHAKQLTSSDAHLFKWRFYEFLYKQFPEYTVGDMPVKVHTLLRESVHFLHLEEHLKQITDPQVLYDHRVAIYGGVARFALKKLLLLGSCKQQDKLYIQSELPINDLDLIIDSNFDYMDIVKQYGVDIASTQIAPDIQQAILNTIHGTDMHMNEVLIHNGYLYFTPEAKKDIETLTVRIKTNYDPLFGRLALPYCGKSYILRRGFYRAFVTLCRGRANTLEISAENLDREKDAIGRYWLTMLFVKFDKIQDVDKRKMSIINWFEIAKQMGVTNAQTPLDFLEELLLQFPEYYPFGFDLNRQVRWLISKLITNAAKFSLNKPSGFDETLTPSTYTPANIALPQHTSQSEYDLTELDRRLASLRK